MKLSTHIPVFDLASFTRSDHKLFDIRRFEQLVNDFSYGQRPHRHDFFELLFISEGSGTHSIDCISYEVKPRSVFWLSPGQVQAWKLSEDIKGYSLFFKPEFYLLHRPGKGTRDIGGLQEQAALYLEPPQAAAVWEILNCIWEENRSHQSDKYDLIRAFLEVLLIKLSRQVKADPQPVESAYLSKLVTRFECLIDEHFAHTRSVADYADFLNVTPKNLSKICKKTLNKTAGDLIRERVLLEAKRLLIHSHLSTGEIVDKLNFYDNSYFGKFFKKETGQTPEQFRRNEQKASA